MTGSPTIYTVGHSTRSFDELLAILEAVGTHELADVRSVQRSRRHPEFTDEALASSLLAHGITYLHERALSGFRSPRPGSPNSGWEDPALRGYADHMQTEEFADALARLQLCAAGHPLCVMCAEAQWWRCRRRLIADALTIRGWRVLHLGLGPDPFEHELTPFALPGEEYTLTYPALQTAPPRAAHPPEG